MIDAALSSEQKAGASGVARRRVRAYDRLADKLQKEPADHLHVARRAAAAEFIGKLRERGIKSLLMGRQQLLAAGFWRGQRAAAEASRSSRRSTR